MAFFFSLELSQAVHIFVFRAHLKVVVSCLCLKFSRVISFNFISRLFHGERTFEYGKSMFITGSFADPYYECHFTSDHQYL